MWHRVVHREVALHIRLPFFVAEHPTAAIVVNDPDHLRKGDSLTPTRQTNEQHNPKPKP